MTKQELGQLAWLLDQLWNEVESGGNILHDCPRRAINTLIEEVNLRINCAGNEKDIAEFVAQFGM